VAAGRVARLAAGDVEADHALVAVTQGDLGDLGGPGGVAHGGDEQPDLDRAVGGGRWKPASMASTASSG
jgi:hypothetical protein